MVKHYIFYRQDIINMLNNYRSYMAQKAQEYLDTGNDKSKLTYKLGDKWTEEFFDAIERDGIVKLETILDEVDQITEKTHGKSVYDIAKEHNIKH